jgi:ABC-type multidrug transport system permease subunit
MTNLSNSAGQFFFHYMTFCLIAFCGSSLGLLLGSVILDAKSVSAIMPIVILPFVLFSGFYKNSGDLASWIGWIQYISPNKYGFIAFIDN